KPIMLSVGYSACHWCHVMAHESFEDPATAEVMNRLFVNVKVDREERPDVDAVYMTAVQSMTGRGGWPMTVFLTPEGQPFYGGTYFPKEDRHGLPGFTTLLEAVDDAWRERREELLPQAGRPAAAVTTSWAGASTATPSTPSGSFPTSRRCSTTRRRWPGPTSTPGWWPAGSATGGWWRRRSTTSCGSCAMRPGASTPPRTPTARARRASSTSGRSTS